MSDEFEHVVWSTIEEGIDTDKVAEELKRMNIDITDRNAVAENFEEACNNAGYDLYEITWEKMDGMFIYFDDAIEYLNSINGWSGWKSVDEFGGFDNITQVAFAFLNDEINEHGYEYFGEYFFDNYLN